VLPTLLRDLFADVFPEFYCLPFEPLDIAEAERLPAPEATFEFCPDFKLLLLIVLTSVIRLGLTNPSLLAMMLVLSAV